MAESKIDFSFENLHFSCEGEKDWVEKQLNQVLNRIPALGKLKAGTLGKTKTSDSENAAIEAQSVSNEPKTPSKRGRKAKAPVVEEEVNNDPLFQFLVDKNADKNQVRKFLAVAVYLYAHDGIQVFSTSIVSKAIKAAKIEKLLNASDCLNKNEKKGFSIKDDKEFTLTEAGIQSILGNEGE